MKVNPILEFSKYYNEEYAKDIEYKKSKKSSGDEHTKFAEILKRERQNTYFNRNH